MARSARHDSNSHSNPAKQKPKAAAFSETLRLKYTLIYNPYIPVILTPVPGIQTAEKPGNHCILYRCFRNNLWFC